MADYDLSAIGKLRFGRFARARIMANKFRLSNGPQRTGASSPFRVKAPPTALRAGFAK